ncbi:HAD family hydrolase [Pelagibaculum spongiae]|uniref:Haloacid dehalogenase-like hydrolase n=1 Tax=Pelagibaculum spongiae TaxID=2080658 RepID=A0A2V1GW20_9GAMM|nr:HAD family hydrolase [Pelagibaculum spongiae]PVZ70528.1 hypothetical protein DC094_08075 [Pelagibaculum spongiae]
MKLSFQVSAVVNIALVIISFLISPVVWADVQLKSDGWNPVVKARLEKLIFENAFKGKKVVFDFDNTTISRDIGEATFAVMAGENRLSTKNIPKSITPPFTLNGKKYSIDTVGNLPDFYEAFLSATKHQKGESTPYSNSYAWVVQIMSGMSPDQIIPFSKTAFSNNMAIKDKFNSGLKESKTHGYRMPFFYPEMVELYGTLIKNGYDVYVCSASNVWTVRWMVLENLNPVLEAQFGEGIKIAADHVIGVSVLLMDKRDGQLYKDPLLVKSNSEYASLNKKELANYQLTSQIVYPITGYFGKVANIMKYISKERPFLIGGDSPNDLPMLDFAENRLWIARLEKMEYQERLTVQAQQSMPGNWLVQPVLYKKSPGFVANQKQLNKRLSVNPSALEKTSKVVSYLKKNDLLEKF